MRTSAKVERAKRIMLNRRVRGWKETKTLITVSNTKAMAGATAYQSLDMVYSNVAPGSSSARIAKAIRTVASVTAR